MVTERWGWMLDHYTQYDLCRVFRVHERIVKKLATVGPGFEIIRIYPTTAPRYIIRKQDLWAWMDAVCRSKKLQDEVFTLAPRLSFDKIREDRAHRARIAHTIRPHSMRLYGRGLTNAETNERK